MGRSHGSRQRSYPEREIDEHIGSRIRMRRNETQVSQADLAEMIGLTFQQVQKYEKGANRIGGSRMLQIARALGVRVSYFFEGLEEDGSELAAATDSVMNKFVASAEGMHIAKSFVKIDGIKTRRAICVLIETLSDGSLT